MPTSKPSRRRFVTTDANFLGDDIPSRVHFETLANNGHIDSTSEKLDRGVEYKSGITIL